jgi:hypothetical protein
VVTGPPSRLVSVGGYRFALHDPGEVARRVEAVATLAALCRQRRVGSAADTMQAALNAVGLYPVAVAAFHDRGDRSVATR